VANGKFRWQIPPSSLPPEAGSKWQIPVANGKFWWQIPPSSLPPEAGGKWQILVANSTVEFATTCSVVN
jgi:hypothetical protein